MMPLKVMPSSGCNWDINKSGGVTHSDPIFFFGQVIRKIYRQNLAVEDGSSFWTYKCTCISTHQGNLDPHPLDLVYMTHSQKETSYFIM